MKRALALSLLAFLSQVFACSPSPPANPLVAGVLSERIGQQSMAQGFYEEAARNGDPVAAYRLGERAEKGVGGKQNMAAAVRWYREARELGYVQADFKLGVLYIEGKGVPKDPGMAAEHFSRAAKGGSPYGAMYMSMLCLDGNGVEKDSVQAYLWANQAIKLCDETKDGIVARNLAENRLMRKVVGAMSPAELARAKELAATREPTL